MMSNTLPKINLGKPVSKKNAFHFPCTYNGTVDFSGYLLPMYMQEMIPNSKLTIDTQSFIRLAPLPKPTFGRMKYHIYYAFQNIADLWMPFDSFMAGQQYSTSATRYIPENMPQMSIATLTRMLLHFGTATYYKISSGGSLDQGNATPITLNEYQSGSGNVKAALLNTFFNGWYSQDSWLPAHTLFTGSNHVTIEGADFVYSFNALQNGVIMAFRFSNTGKLLRKMFMGLGYQLDLFSNEKVNVLPLFGYFKSWFEIFAPQRNITWKDTSAYKLLDFLRVQARYNLDAFFSSSGDQTLINNFISELRDCFYTYDADFYSAHIATPAINGTVTQPKVASYASLIDGDTLTINNNTQPSISPSQISGNGISQQKLKVLQKMYNYINKKTVAGGKIDKFLRSIGLAVSDDHSGSNFGSMSFPIQIGDVMATNATEFETLGEYAGSGKGWTSGNKKHTFSSNDHYGYAYVLGCIVPDAEYVQGVNPNLKHLKRFEFFHDFLDGVGFQITKKDSILGMRDVVNASEITQPQSFGLIPRYSEMKVGYSVTTGDLSLRSKRADMLAYTLDRWITPTEIDSTTNDTSGAVSFTMTQEANAAIPIASDSYRYFGKYAWMSNFNRIFYNESGNPLDDNFIIHALFDVNYFAPMKSMADSFETFDEDDDNGVVSVQHQ